MDGKFQPDPQSVGAYDFKNKKLVFVYDGKLHIYNMEGSPESSIAINWGSTSSSGGELIDSDPEDYNYTSLVYTGIPKSEIGLLNVSDKRIELYDIATGNLSRKLSLPEECPTEMSFNFAYTNGIYWFFDIEGRTWHGYK